MANDSSEIQPRLPRSSHASIYHALEGKIQKRHAMGYLRRDGGASVSAVRLAADPLTALAARVGCQPSDIPLPAANVTLPTSELLDAIHGYAANIFAEEYTHSLRGLDESALLVMGMMAESLITDTIGQHGHLLLEGSEEAERLEAGVYDGALHGAAQRKEVYRVLDDDMREASHITRSASTPQEAKNDSQKKRSFSAETETMESSSKKRKTRS